MSVWAIFRSFICQDCIYLRKKECDSSPCKIILEKPKYSRETDGLKMRNSGREIKNTSISSSDN